MHYDELQYYRVLQFDNVQILWKGYLLITRRGKSDPVALEDPLVQTLATKYRKTPAQVRKPEERRQTQFECNVQSKKYAEIGRL